MTWQAITNNPVLNARQRWEKQEHDRRVRLLGERLAEDWAQVVGELALDDGHLSQDRVLQLMEDAYNMGVEVKPARGTGAAHTAGVAAAEPRGRTARLRRRLPLWKRLLP